MKTAGFMSEYIPLDFSRQRIPSSQQPFDTGTSLSNFDFGFIFSE